MKEQLNKEAKEGWSIAADAAGIIDERASSEDREHTSGGVIVAVIKKIKSKGRMDARNRWWVTEIFATDCAKAWIHSQWEDTMQKCTKGWNT